MLEGYVNKITDTICIDWYDIPWEDKKSKAYFHGAWTGKAFYPDDGGPISREKKLIQSIDNTKEVPEGSGHPHGRYKLMWQAHWNPDLIDFSWSVRQERFYVPDEFLEQKFEDRCFK